MLERLRKNNYKLIVENIIWGKPQAMNNKYYPYYIYGTINNWAEFARDHLQKEWGGYEHHGGLTMRYTNILAPNGLILEKDDLGLVKPPWGLGERQHWNALWTQADTVGYGIHIYTVGKSAAEISTWDKLNFPDSEAPAPDASSLTDYPEETPYGEKSKTFKIVKYYELSLDGGTTYMPSSYHGRENTPHSISIDDEDYYKVAGYFTSTKEESYPPNDGDTLSYIYGDQKSLYNDGKYKGDKAGSIQVLPEDADRVLHVLLRSKENTDKTIDVVKVYESDGITDNVDIKKAVDVSGNVYPVTSPDGKYIYKESTTTPSPLLDGEAPSNWTEVPQENLTTSKEIPIAEDTNTIYIHYIKGTPPPSETGNASITIHENELSYPFSIAEIGTNYQSIKHTFPNKSDSGSSHHHSEDSDGNCDGYDCNWHTQINDGTYLIEVANTMDYNATTNIGAQGAFAGAETGKVSTSSGEVSAVIGGFNANELNPNWKFVAYRDRTKDLVTLYPNSNDPMNKNMVGLIGIHNESSIPAGSRIAKEGGNKFTGSFKTNYVYTDTTDKGLSWNSTGCSSGHGTSGNYSGVESIGISDFNNLFSGSNIVTTKYYLGKANKGEKEVSTSVAIPKIFDKEYKTHMSGFLNNNNYVNLYPYIQMQYKVLDGTGSTVNVTSENLSKIKIANKVEVGMYREGNEPNLQLESTQWSTHAKSLEGLQANGISDKYSILPGGAASTLTTGKNGVKTHLGIKTYQTVVEDNLKELLAPESSILTVSEANAQYETFKAQAKDVLEHYQIVQWVGKGIDTDLMEFWERSDTEIVSGTTSSGSFAGSNLSTDSKYYLKTDGNGADRADLDIVGENSRKTTWKIASDTQGNVVVTKDNVEAGRINQTQAVTQLLANLEIKELNDKTKIIENYILAIDRNQGNDRDGNKWYNEAFNGITVIINEWDIELGFGGNNPTRGSILDTKLCGVQTDRRDTYNFKPETINDKVRTSMFAVSSQSTSAQAAGKPEGYLGNLGDMVVGINGVQNIFNSKLFYIPNATVTDLN